MVFELIPPLLSTDIFYFKTWNLEVGSGGRIKLTFESFDLEANSDCRYDYVQISNEYSQQKYCGSRNPGPIISSGNTMTVTFHSDDSENGNGFKAKWENVSIVQSPNYPSPYPNNIDKVIFEFNNEFLHQ